MELLAHLLKAWTRFVIRRPRLILAVAFAAAVGSVVLTATKLEMITDQLELIAKDHPLIALTDRLIPFQSDGARRFDVVVESPTPEAAVAFAKDLARQLESDPAHFKSVFYRVDPDQFKTWQLLYLSKGDLAKLSYALDAHAELLHSFAEKPDLLNFLGLINREMASRMVGELFTGFLDKKAPDAADQAEGAKQPFDLSFVIATLEGMSASLREANPTFQSPWFALLGDASWSPDLEGYFWEANKRFLMLFVTPMKTKEGVVLTQRALERLRSCIRELEIAHPGVTAGVTGQEALNNDEMHTVLGDMTTATWLSILGVFILLVLFRRSFRRPVLQMASLTVGLCWSFGFATLFVGHLNILSVVFAPLLCGLGVDSGIHWFSRLEEEERCPGMGMAGAVQRVGERSGPGIVLACCSTALSFLPFMLTGFRALVELGLITGMGILLNLFADLSVLPALALLAAGKPRNGNTREAEAAARDMIRFTPARARTALIGAALVSAVCVFGATRVYFDLNPLRLQTANAESVVWEKTLIENSKRSALYINSLASSPEETLTKEKKIEALPSVSEVETVFSLLPEDQEEKIPILRALDGKVPRMQPIALESRSTDVQDFVDVLERVRFKLQDDQAERWGAGRPLVEQMRRARELAADIIAILKDDPYAVHKLMRYREFFAKDLAGKWDDLRIGVNASPMRVADLPENIRGWFLQGGTYLLRIFPKESIWEEHALARFITEVQSVDPQVVGDPVSIYVFATAFRSACISASVYAIIAILILLMLTFRDIRLTFLAFIPLALGTLWTVGIMGAANIQFNLANSVFMPLVVGAGVEYAVIILSRWREGRMKPGHLPWSTAKGVILAALTTTAGFGALMISHHRGIFSLGFVAWSGSLCVLASAILVLPAVLAGLPPVQAQEEVCAVNVVERH